MGVLKLIRELVKNLSPEQVAMLLQLLKLITGNFAAQGFQAKGAASTTEETETIDAFTAKGVDESEARGVVRNLNA